MRVTIPVDINPNQLISSSATEIHNPPAYVAGTTYDFGSIIKVAADYKIYESLFPNNAGHQPSTSPIWWRVVGPTEDAWAVGTTYALGATVSYNRRCYESLAAGNVGNTPPLYPEIQTEKWFDVGPTNKWASFDLNSNTQTVTASPLVIVFRPGERANTLGVTGMKANSIQVSATSATGGGQVYPNSSTASDTGVFDLNTREVRDGYDYAFEPFSTIPSNVIFDLPPFSDIEITITISSTSGNVKCGSIVAGTYIYIGKVLQRATADSLNFSTVERDIYGTATLVPRPAKPKTKQTLLLPSSRLNKVMAAKKSLDAKPALWTGMDDPTSDWFEMLQVLGIWNEFTFGAETHDMVEITLGLEEI